MQQTSAISRILLVIAATLATAGVICGVGYLFGARSIGFAFLVNWFITTWAAATSSAQWFSPPPTYYRLRSFENGGRLYRVFGVQLYRLLLRRTPLAILNPTLRYAGNRASLLDLDLKMRQAEASHLLIFLIVLAITLGFAVYGWLDSVIWLTVFNVLINVYPIMVQRYNRGRISPLITRLVPHK